MARKEVETLDRGLAKYLTMSALLILLFPVSLWAINQIHLGTRTATFTVAYAEHLTRFGEHTNVYVEDAGPVPHYQFFGHIPFEAGKTYTVTYRNRMAVWGFTVWGDVLHIADP